MSAPVATATSRAFERRIQGPRFPCLGAKSALAQSRLGFLEGGDLRSSTADAAVVAGLQAFARQSAPDDTFVSTIALFPETPCLDEVAFEMALWHRLQAFHAIDAVEHAWDPAVSSDPDSPEFSMSIGGRGFYVIGLHPNASRQARRFSCAALVFNLHSQFERLRTDGRYQKLQQAIAGRDVAFSGSRNPMLAMHGQSSAARQYSGRVLEAEWQCPFLPGAAAIGSPDA